jgi:hypothetical protein
VYETDGFIDFVCFTDDRSLSSAFWRMQFMPTSLLDPARASKAITNQSLI